MATKRDMVGEYVRWKTLPLYQQFEQVIVCLLVILIAVVIIGAMWNLVMIVVALALLQGFDPVHQTAI